MPDSEKDKAECPTCGASIQQTGVGFEGSCPKCLLSDLFSPGGEGEVREIEQRIEGYELLKQIGSGGMGKVYRARQTALGREVAVKFLHEDMDCHFSNARRFRREAETMASLNHPNIVSVIDYGESQAGEPFIVMELVRGGSLQRVMESKERLSERRYLKWLMQICSALEYAHGKGVVHRDIKPSNILISKDRDDVKVSDFGLAKMAGPRSDITDSGHSLGTAYFASPEQVEGRRDIDSRTDTYSFGVMFYQILTGKLPQGSTWVPPSQVSSDSDPRFDDIVRRSMHRIPSERFQSAAEIADRLGVIASANRKRKGVLAAGLFAISAALALYFFFFNEAVSPVSRLVPFEESSPSPVTPEAGGDELGDVPIARFSGGTVSQIQMDSVSRRVVVVLDTGGVEFVALPDEVVADIRPRRRKKPLFLAGIGSGSIQIWDTRSKKPVEFFKAPRGHTSAVALSPNGKRLIRFRREELSYWGYERENPDPIIEVAKAKVGITTYAAFFLSDDEHFVAVQGRGERFPDLKTRGSGIEIFKFGEDDPVTSVIRTADGFTCAAISPDRTKLIAGGRGGRVVLVDIADSVAVEVLKNFTLGEAGIREIRYLGGDRAVLIVDGESTLKIVDLEAGAVEAEIRCEVEAVTAIGVAASGRWVYYAGEEKGGGGSGLFLHEVNDSEFFSN